MIVGVPKGESGGVGREPQCINFATVSLGGPGVIQHEPCTLKGNRLQVVGICLVQSDIDTQTMFWEFSLQAQFIRVSSFRFKNRIGLEWDTVSIDAARLIACAVGAVEHGDIVHEPTELDGTGDLVLIEILIHIRPWR